VDRNDPAAAKPIQASSAAKRGENRAAGEGPGSREYIHARWRPRLSLGADGAKSTPVHDQARSHGGAESCSRNDAATANVQPDSSSASSRQGGGHILSKPARDAPRPSSPATTGSSWARGARGRKALNLPGWPRPHGPAGGGQKDLREESWGNSSMPLGAGLRRGLQRTDRSVPTAQRPVTHVQSVEGDTRNHLRAPGMDVRDYLHAGTHPVSTLRSIPTDRLLPKAREILSKRRRKPCPRAEGQDRTGVALLDAKILLGKSPACWVERSAAGERIAY